MGQGNVGRWAIVGVGGWMVAVVGVVVVCVVYGCVTQERSIDIK